VLRANWSAAEGKRTVNSGGGQVRQRIVSVAMRVTSVAIILFALPLAAAVYLFFLSDERAELERAAVVAAATVGPDFVEGDPTRLPDTESDISVGVYKPPGELTAGQGPAAGGEQVSRSFHGVPVQGSAHGQIVETIPVYSGDDVIAVIRTATPLWSLWQRVLATWAAMVGLGVVAVATAVIVARRQARLLATPLQSVASAAQALGEGDFSARAAGSDVPEINQTAEALNVTAQRLGALVARERSFSANASHQLRTPLTALRLQLEAAPGDLTPAIALADELERTIEDLLLLARGAGPAAGTSGPVDGEFGGRRQRWAAAATAVGRQLRVESEPDLPRVFASAAVVGQVVDVLVDNALRHGSGAVVVSVRDAGGAVAIDVADQGDSLAHGTVDIFERGISGSSAEHPDAAAAGHGIGLALARDLAQSQGGRLLLTRTSPGTVFTVLIPAAG
jgi:signal transduction histidine kinase